MAGKYENIYLYLKSIKDDYVTMSFSEIEKIMGSNLPPYMRKYRAGWLGRSGVDPTNVQKRTWEKAGFTVDKVNLKIEIVTYRRLSKIEIDSIY